MTVTRPYTSITVIFIVYISGGNQALRLTAVQVDLQLPLSPPMIYGRIVFSTGNIRYILIDRVIRLGFLNKQYYIKLGTFNVYIITYYRKFRCHSTSSIQTCRYPPSLSNDLTLYKYIYGVRSRVTSCQKLCLNEYKIIRSPTTSVMKTMITVTTHECALFFDNNIIMKYTKYDINI